MRRAAPKLLFGVLISLIAPPIYAGEDSAPTNAAPLILTVWDESHKEYVWSRAISEAMQGVMLDGWVASPRILAELSNDSRMGRIDGVVEAETCDFGLDLSEGPYLELPHIAPARAAANLLIAEARLRIDAGDYNKAADAIGGVFAIVRHLGADGSLITVRVRSEIVVTAYAVLLRLPPDAWGAADFGALKAELDRLPAEDPFGLRRAVSQETVILSDWVVAQNRTPEGRRATWDLLDMMANGDGSDAAPSRWELGPSVLEFGGLEACGRAFRDVGAMQAAAIDVADPEQALTDIQTLVQAGDFGPLAPYFVLNPARAMQAVRHAEATVAMIRIILEGDAEEG